MPRPDPPDINGYTYSLAPPMHPDFQLVWFPLRGWASEQLGYYEGIGPYFSLPEAIRRAEALIGEQPWIPMVVRAAVSTPAPPPSELQLRYDELLYAVAMKYPGESRHQTALRYIRQAERQSHQAALAVTERTPIADSAEILSLGRRQEDGPRD